MQDLGLVRAYMGDSEVKGFIKMLDAIPFLPIEKIGKKMFLYFLDILQLFLIF